jgi:hypothetical protein
MDKKKRKENFCFFQILEPIKVNYFDEEIYDIAAGGPFTLVLTGNLEFLFLSFFSQKKKGE